MLWVLDDLSASWQVAYFIIVLWIRCIICGINSRCELVFHLLRSWFLDNIKCSNCKFNCHFSLIVLIFTINNSEVLNQPTEGEGVSNKYYEHLLRGILMRSADVLWNYFCCSAGRDKHDANTKHFLFDLP